MRLPKSVWAYIGTLAQIARRKLNEVRAALNPADAFYLGAWELGQYAQLAQQMPLALPVSYLLGFAVHSQDPDRRRLIVRP